MNKKHILLIITGLVFALIFTLYFNELFAADEVLHSGDYNYYAAKMNYRHGVSFFNKVWDTSFKLGLAKTYRPLNMQNLMHSIFPPLTARHINFIFPFFLLFITSFLLFSNFSRPVRFLGSLMLAFSPLGVSYILTGHESKTYVIAFAPLALLFFKKAASPRGRLFHYLLAGFILGFMFLQIGVQTALYFAFLLTAYYLVMQPGAGLKTWFKQRLQPAGIKKLLLFLIIPLITVVFSFGLLQSFMGKSERGQGDIPGKEFENTQGWEWATQWSFPPEETVDFFMPGLFGYHSSSRQAPYWGRIGRSASWTPENRKGMRNLCLNSNYFGIFLFLFAVMGLVFVRKKEVYFWGGALLIALLLSYGKFIPPFYRLFYYIPMMDKFRNPNKFLHIVHFCAGMLAVYGLDYFLQAFRADAARRRALTGSPAFKYFAAVAAGLGAAAVIFYIMAQTALAGSLQNYWQTLYNSKVAHRIYEHFMSSVLHFIPVVFSIAALLLLGFSARVKQDRQLNILIWFIFMISGAMAFLGWYMHWAVTVFIILFLGVIFAVLRQSDQDGGERLYKFLLVLFTLFIIFDQYYVNRHYITTEKDETGRDFPVLQKIKQLQQQGRGRIKFLPRGGKMGQHYILKYGLSSIDPPAQRSPDKDIDSFLSTASPVQLKRYSVLNIKYLVTTPRFGQIIKYFYQTRRRDLARFYYIYKDVLTRTRHAGNFNGYNLFINTNVMPRAVFAHSFFTLTNFNNIVNTMTSPAFKPEKEVLFVQKGGYSNRFPATPPKQASTITIAKYRPREVVLKVQAAAKGMAVLADYYHSGWQAFLDGKQVPVHRADYFYRGVFVDKGEHKLVFRYQSVLWQRVFYFILFFIFIGLSLYYSWYKLKKTADR